MINASKFKRSVCIISPKLLRSCRRHHSSKESDLVIEIKDSDPIKFQFNKFARFADGSCVTRIRDTAILTTAVSENRVVGTDEDGSTTTKNVPSSFVPLTVNFKQKSAASGRIPRTFARKDSRFNDEDILVSRIIDRSVRPLFPKNFGAKTEISCNILANDNTGDCDILAINGSSASLAIASNIPWMGPVGACKVGFVDDEFCINPTRKQSENSKLNLAVVGTRHGNAVMLEASATELDYLMFADGVEFGLKTCGDIATQIATFADISESTEVSSFIDPKLMNDMRNIYGAQIDEVYDRTDLGKIERDEAVSKVRGDWTPLKELHPEVVDTNIFNIAFIELCRELIAHKAIQFGRRVDGRKLSQLRDISCSHALYGPLHGSSLFQRGQTQVMSTVTLDSLEASQRSIETELAVRTNGLNKNFMLHYEFPQYATNELSRGGGGANRREIGHGALAEKGLRPVLPTDYDFAVRVSCEVLESNGSSSMASVCGGTLALLDAGVPITSSAAGVAIGMMSKFKIPKTTSTPPSAYVILSDITGMEDFLGDMDFKVAGTLTSITALQADVKLHSGLSPQMIRDSLTAGRKSIRKILSIMAKDIAKPATGKTNLPVSHIVNVPLHRRQTFIGPGGRNISYLESEIGVQCNKIESSPDSSNASLSDEQSSSGLSYQIFAPNQNSMNEAKEFIDSIMKKGGRKVEYKFGDIIKVKILEIAHRGISVEVHPTLDSVFIPNSQLATGRISDANVLNFKVGEEILVKHFGINPETGATRLSRTAVLISRNMAINAVRAAKPN